MSIRIIAMPDGIKSTGQSPTETRRYKIVGTSNQNTVNGYAIAATPAIIATIYGLLFRQDIQSSQTAYNQWTVEVPYGPRKSVTGDFTWDFDTTGGTIHITQAKAEAGRFPAATAPDQKGAIAVDGDEVKGTEIIIPAMKINVNFRHPLGVMTLSQAKFLSSITGSVNNDSFLTFAPGEVLFLGARGSDGTDAEATVSYQFAMAANQTGMTIGGIAGVSKKAWEVAWIRYEDAVTTADGKDLPTRDPKFVYVDRVYDEIAMAAALGFGGM
jgi:hypothetical protein